MRVAAGLVGALLVACNGIAGIADLRTGDLDASTGDGAVSGDAATTLDGATEVDAPPASCAQAVRLTITVESSGTAFLGVTDTNNKIGVAKGSSQDFCFPSGTSLDLRGDPDDSNASHAWAGAPCASPAGRCSFNLDGPTTIDVTL